MMERRSYLFVTLEGGGNVPAVLGLVRRLTERGHTVRVLTEPCLRESVEGAGARFIAFREHFTREDATEPLLDDWKASTPIDGLKRSFDQAIFGPAPIVAAAARQVIEREPTDVVAVDVMMPGALVAAEAAGIPRVVLFHMPEYLPGPGRPSAGPGFLPRNDLLGRLRDGLLAGFFFRVLRGYLGGFNELRRSFGLASFADERELLGMFHTADRRLIMTSRDFDFPLDPAPANVRYVGPILDDPAWLEAAPALEPGDDSRPLVVVSFSTTFQNQRGALERVIAALGRLDVRGLVTLGPAMSTAEFDLPPNVTTVAGLPHSLIFPRAAAVVTHAGHGTIMRALAAGVPLLCMPMGRDQNDNAARVFHHGAGLRLKPTAGASKIASAVQRLLTEQRFRAKARTLGETIRRDAAEDRGVTELEELAMSARREIRAQAAMGG